MNNVAVFAANRGFALRSSREQIIVRFLESGWTVVLATADDDDSRYLVERGAILEPVVFERGGLSLCSDYLAYRKLKMIYRKWCPRFIHHFHAKPIIMGTIAAKKLSGYGTVVVNTVTGLGHAFIIGGWITHLAGMGYRLALPSADTTVFQNRDDLALFLERSWVSESNSKLIVGSGVDIERFSFFDREGRDGYSPNVVMLGRLLGQKGVREFVAVAEAIRESYPNSKFLWAGEEDLTHPDSVTVEWIEEQGSIEYLGRLDDVTALLRDADILLFPSYREGVPRAVMEAAATGLPTVAFCVAGVKEAVVNDKTGYLVPFGDIEKLKEKISFLIENQTKRLDIGLSARAIAESNFDIRVIQEDYIRTYRELGVEV